MTSSMRLALVAVCMFAFTFSVGSNTALATPIDLDKQAKALSILADFADRVCSQVKDYGSASDYLATVDAKAQLDGLSKKFVDLGISLNGMYTGHSFQNVAQVDLPKAMEVSSNCKLEIRQTVSSGFYSAGVHPEQNGCIHAGHSGCHADGKRPSCGSR